MNASIGSTISQRGVPRGCPTANIGETSADARLVRMRELIERGHGGVWGDFIDGKGIHFVVRWDEWPAPKSIRDMRLKLIAQRTQIVADIIEAGYRHEGSALFQFR